MNHYSRQDYFRIAKIQGLSSALSALHDRIRDVERLSFRGDDGYQPELLDELREMREFSRELWNLNQAPDSEES